STAKAPVFLVSQDHVEVGRIQGRQIAALLPTGGSVLYLRGPATNSLASLRSTGIDATIPNNVDPKSLKIHCTHDSALQAISSWLNLSTTKPEATQLIASQNADFILAAKKAFETSTDATQRSKWLALPCLGVGVASQLKPLVDGSTLRA